MLKANKPLPDVDCLKYKGEKDKPDIKIFVSHRIDLDSAVVDNPLYIPVRCGAVYDERTEEEIGGMLGDDTGDNISEKRNSFCELTVQYWAWKNVEADYYGLCHYRRYMSFGEKKKTDVYNNIMVDYIDDDTCQQFKLCDVDFIKEIVSEFDVIVTEPYVVSNGPMQSENLIEQYCELSTMFEEDLLLALQIIKTDYPEYYDSAKSYLNNNLFYPDNLFIIKKSIFNDYSKWLFDILFKLERKINKENRCKEANRAVGMIGERLMGIYLYHLLKNNEDIKLKTLQRVVFMKPINHAPIVPQYKQKNIPIVFASSDYYTPYTAITIYTALKNANPDYNYDVIILSSDMEQYAKNKLKTMIKDFSNAHIRFIDMNPWIGKKEKKLKVVGAHISKETFYRLLVPEIFSNYERIIYLDSDLVIEDDVSKLYTLEMDNKVIAATRDPDFVGEYNGAIPYVKKYCDNTISSIDPFKYFQAGVLVFNIKEMKRVFKPYELIDYAMTDEFLYVDQDVLNVKCFGKVCYLPQRWNVMVDCLGIRVKELIARAPEYMFDDYMEARLNPAVIHYAGSEKPWTSPLSDYSEVFWKYARQTIFYEAIIYRMHDISFNKIEGNINNLNLITGVYDTRSAPRKAIDKLCPPGTVRRKVGSRLIPVGSKRRKLLKNVYYIFKPQYRPKNKTINNER